MLQTQTEPSAPTEISVPLIPLEIFSQPEPVYLKIEPALFTAQPFP